MVGIRWWGLGGGDWVVGIGWWGLGGGDWIKTSSVP